MHREQLSIMFVGGPNERTDFHLEEGSEFFLQLRGNMQLPIVHAGQREVINIREGDVFLLPSRIPHSPQRPEEGSVGLVIERERYDHESPDGLRFYVDFQTCKEVLWERYFRCHDLGKDLVPVVQAFRASEECATGNPTGDNVFDDPPLNQDTTTAVPPPFNLEDWLTLHSTQLERGATLNLFDGHPDSEFSVNVVGGESEQSESWQHESWLYQLRGNASITVDGETTELAEGSCVVVPGGMRLVVRRPQGSVGMVVRNDPTGNK